MPTAPVFPIAAQPGLTSASRIGLSQPGAGPQFSQVLAQALEQLEQVHEQSDALAEAYAAGQDIEIHDLMIALQQTEVAFDLAVQVRNKIVEAYQEIMRMQI